MLVSARIVCSLMVVTLCLTGSLQAQQQFQTAQEALKIGMAHLRDKNWAGAQEALEAALKLTSDKKLEAQIIRALLTPHQKDADYTKYKTTVEHIIRHPNSPAEKSVYRSQLVGFLHARGKSEESAKHYETILQKTPDDAATLYVLSKLYATSIRDPKKSTEVTERFIKVSKDMGEKIDPQVYIELAREYTELGRLLVQAGQPKEGAEVYEKLAGSDAKNGSLHLKDAATAWLKAGEKDKALTAARTAAKGPPDMRTKGLTHFWHRQLADVFLETGEYPLAVEHFRKAVDNAENDRFRQDCQKKLELAKKKAA